MVVVRAYVRGRGCATADRRQLRRSEAPPTNVALHLLERLRKSRSSSNSFQRKRVYTDGGKRKTDLIVAAPPHGGTAVVAPVALPAAHADRGGLVATAPTARIVASSSSLETNENSMACSLGTKQALPLMWPLIYGHSRHPAMWKKVPLLVPFFQFIIDFLSSFKRKRRKWAFPHLP